jgi:SPP1 gp7 family putative phage head morphogenesis protein
MDAVIKTYTEAMARVASGVDEGRSVAVDTDREYNLMRLHDAMADDLEAISEEWMEETKDAAIRTSDKVLHNMGKDIKLGNIAVPREEATLLAIGIQTNVRTVADDLLKDVARIAAEGYQQGLGAEQIARNIEQDSDTVRWNAKRMVRTETMRVCDVISKNRYEAAGCDGYMSYPTDDDRLCTTCLQYATGGTGTRLKVYGLDEPMTLPWHPNCRCCRIPHFEGVEVSI